MQERVTTAGGHVKQPVEEDPEVVLPVIENFLLEPAGSVLLPRRRPARRGHPGQRNARNTGYTYALAASVGSWRSTAVSANLTTGSC